MDDDVLRGLPRHQDEIDDMYVEMYQVPYTGSLYRRLKDYNLVL